MWGLYRQAGPLRCIKLSALFFKQILSVQIEFIVLTVVPPSVVIILIAVAPNYEINS